MAIIEKLEQAKMLIREATREMKWEPNRLLLYRIEASIIEAQEKLGYKKESKNDGEK